MSKLVKLKLASKKSLACFLPSSMASSSSGTESTLFGEPEARPTRPNGINQPKSKASEIIQPVRDVPGRPNGSNSKAMVVDKDKPKAETHLGTNSRAMVDKDKPKASENMVRDMVSYGTKEKEKEKEKEAPKVEPEEEVEELKTPGFIRVFGCDNCAHESTSDTEDTLNRPSCSHHSSSDDASDDDDAHHHHHHQPPHLIPVVHLRVPMKNEDDVRKVVAALQTKGVLEVACDLENQIVKVSGTADPDRLLKKVKKVKRKSRLISYSNPREHLPSEDYSIPPFHGHNSYSSSTSVPLQPPRHYYEPGFHRPPPPVPPAAVYYDHHHHHHHHRPPPTTSVRPPPAAAGFYDHELNYGRAPSSPPHYGSRGYYPERTHRSTSPPRRRSYRSFRPPPPPPPPPVVPPGPPLHYGGRPWIPSAPYGMDDFHQMPHRSMHMYH